jgi:hypothetical protein
LWDFAAWQAVSKASIVHCICRCAGARKASMVVGRR